MAATLETPSPRRWRSFRLVFRILFFTVLTWFCLGILWIAIPFPSAERRDPRYAASVLKSGGTLVRVYPSHNWRIPANERQGFSLSYTISTYPTPSLTLAGSRTSLPLFNPNVTPAYLNQSEVTQRFHASARTGDTDGANLPWFPFADAVLLFWQIHRESIPVDLEARWQFRSYPQVEEVGHASATIQRLDICLPGKIGNEPLISIDVEDPSQPGKVWVKIDRVFVGEGSASPSWTYGIRACIIFVLAPMTVLANDFLGSLIPIGFDAVSTVFAILVCGFSIVAVVVSLWRCVGGPSLESTRGGLREMVLRVDRRYSWMRLSAVQEKIDWLIETRQMEAFLRVCREGWHPERDREREEVENRDEDGLYDNKA